MRRGDVVTARLDPVEGSEQAGTRPVVIVSRDAINQHAPWVIAVAVTTFRGKRLAPGHVLVAAGEAGLDRDSVVLTEQIRVLARVRLGRVWGSLSPATVAKVDAALAGTLDLPTGGV